MFMFIEQNWHDNLISLLVAINTSLGFPSYTTPLSPLTEQNIIKISTSLQNKKYQPKEWFSTQEKNTSIKTISTASPTIGSQINYKIMLLLFEPSGLEMVSTLGRGIIFEDPFYAILASFNVGYFQEHWVEVQVPSRERAWQQRQSIVGTLVNNTYHPKNYFHRASFPTSNANEENINICNMSGKDLSHLEFNGMAGAALNSGPEQRYLLYKYIAP